VKNITVSLPDDVYRNARVKAAERDTSVSALVKQFLIGLAEEESEFERRKRLQTEVLSTITGFEAGERLNRDEVQLQEFYVQAVRTSRPERLSHKQASLLIEAFLRFPVLETTVELALAAVRSAQRFGISYWHAAIIEAARILGCTVVLTEDLNDGQNYGGVRVENPFRGG
jgi:predicted nucleic acid-binding protein